MVFISKYNPTNPVFKTHHKDLLYTNTYTVYCVYICVCMIHLAIVKKWILAHDLARVRRYTLIHIINFNFIVQEFI